MSYDEFHHSFIFPGQQQPARTSELFRADLISAMKLPDSHYLEPSSYVEIKEPWRTEWEMGVQVCVNPESLRKAESSYVINNEELAPPTKRNRRPPNMPSTYMVDIANTYLPQDDVISKCTYEIDELDMSWLANILEKRQYKSLVSELSEELLQQAILLLEKKCYQALIKSFYKRDHHLLTDNSISFKVCDVCRKYESEEDNQLISCSSCCISVHQMCYGIQVIPKDCWLCKLCASQHNEIPCSLCSNKGGAMKKIRAGSGWAHLSCAQWIPEVKIGNADKMEPITNIESIPSSRWNLLCCICNQRRSVCIQCSYPLCTMSYHVTCALDAKLYTDTSSHNNYQSYCPRHSVAREMSSLSNDVLQLVEEEFYDHVTLDNLTNELHLSPHAASLVYNYWKLKKKCKHNQPLIKGLASDLYYPRIQTHYDMVQTSFSNDENYSNIIHLRQNLEKARNLLYMTHRREKLKCHSIDMSHKITRLQIKLEEDKVKQPLCLKRLGISLEPKLFESDQSTLTSDVRILRKRTGQELEDHTYNHHKR